MTCYGVGNASLFPRYERVTSNNGVGSGIRVPYYPKRPKPSEARSPESPKPSALASKAEVEAPLSL